MSKEEDGKGKRRGRGGEERELSCLHPPKIRKWMFSIATMNDFSLFVIRPITIVEIIIEEKIEGVGYDKGRR
jgi:hypothetical protein